MISSRRSLAVAVIMAVLVGCNSPFDTRDHLYDGVTLVEFAPVMPAGNYTRQVGVPVEAEAPVPAQVRIQYISSTPPSGTVTGTIRVVETSTASEGRHVTFPDGRTWSIREGEFFTDLAVQFIPAGLSAGESVTLILELEDGEGFQASPNYRLFTFVFSKAG